MKCQNKARIIKITAACRQCTVLPSGFCLALADSVKQGNGSLPDKAPGRRLAMVLRPVRDQGLHGVTRNIDGNGGHELE